MTVTVPESLVPLLYGVLVVLGVPDQPVHVGPGQVIRLAALAPHVPGSLCVTLYQRLYPGVTWLMSYRGLRPGITHQETLATV